MKTTQARLQQLLDYNPETGVFTWRLDRGGKARKGTPAGSLQSSGYVRITIDDKPYPAHRLAWLYMTGDLPPALIDHKNRLKADNRWVNLRAATKAQNALNAKTRRDNQTGCKHVTRNKKKWEVRMQVDGQLKYLGSFKTLESASEYASKVRELLHGDFINHGTENNQ